MRDRMMLGMTAGLLANVPKVMVGHAAKARRLASTTHREIAAGMFMDSTMVNMPAGMMLGCVVDFALASLYGVLAAFALERVGRDYWPVKGAMLGYSLWTFGIGVMSRLGATKVYPLSPQTNWVLLGNHLLWGMLTAGLISHLGEDLFSGRPEKRPNLPRRLRRHVRKR